MFNRLLVIMIAVGVSLDTAFAEQEVDCAVSSVADDQLTDGCSQIEIADESPWQIGLGLGYGQRSNPRLNSDDTNLYGIVQLAYFGDRFFFDNGDLGVYLLETPTQSLNLIAGVGGERSLFSLFNDDDFGFAPYGEAGSINVNQGFLNAPGLAADFDLTEIKPPDRKYTLDGGLEWIYLRENWDLKAQLLTDISGRHKGQQIWLSAGRVFEQGSWSLYASAGVNWMNSQTVNYYYGISNREALPGLPAYRTDASFSPYGRLSLSYRLNEHWSVISLLHYQRFMDEIADSPTLEKDDTTTFFLGLYYGF